MSIYNWEYYSCMLKNNVATAKSISLARWRFVAESDPRIVLDYGAGCNFFSMFAPEGVVVDSYDIGNINGRCYPQTGFLHDKYDLVTFWDVLEHVDWNNAPDELILSILERSDLVAVSVPILTKDIELERWKHYKPGEHLTYFAPESLDSFFADLGFRNIKRGRPECPPRSDILSVLYRRDK